MPEPVLIELLYGKGAHANPIACVEDLSAELAGRKVDNLPHSIWQLVWHMNFWTDHDLRRIRLENPRYPKHASESWPSESAPSSETEWKKEAARFAESIATLAVMAVADATELSREVPPTHASHSHRTSTVVALLWQISAHNSYHVGQIALLRRALRAWPPRGGGDSW
jgi:uncharacterized damage-inducible protein DinB